MKIEVNLELLEKTDLTLNELTFLQIIFNKKAKELYYIKHLGIIDYYDLERRGYIKFNPTSVTVQLREKALVLFQLSVDVFKEWYLTYPEKTPDGRNLRTTNINTVQYNSCRSTWNRLFKGKPDEAAKALQTLKDEIEYRTKNGSLEYMSNIKNWLDNGMYQNEYDIKELDRQHQSSSLTQFDDI